MEKLTIEQIEDIVDDLRNFDFLPVGREGRKPYEQICKGAEQMRDELLGYKQLEEQIGCPLEVRVLLFRGEHVFGEGCMYEIINTDESGFWAEEIVRNGECLGERFLPYKEYKFTWCLKPDKSE